MIRAFIDASVLYAASLSSTGASREIIRQALRGKVILVVSPLVLEEAERNLAEDAPEVLPTFHLFVNTVPLEMVCPTRRQVLAASRYTALKDAPIVAAARKAKVDYLTNLDRHHLVEKKEVAERSGLKIILPHELLEEIRKQASSN